MTTTGIRTFGAAFLFVAALPVCARAQACLGIPSADRQFAIQGAVGITDGSTSYGVGVNADLAGPLSIFAGYDLVTLDDVDENANSFGGGLAWELSVPGLSICPVSGISYTRWSDRQSGVEVTVSATVIPLGVGIGRSFPAGQNLHVTLYGVPQFQHIRGSIEGSQGDISIGVSDSTNEFGADLGIKFGGTRFFAGGAVGLTTAEGSDPVFTLSIGTLVGSS